jgi:tetratricopeptide (TPR) repeat protein
MEMDPQAMGTSNRAWSWLLLGACVISVAQASGQVLGSGETVRHHKIAESDPSFPPELAQAETAIEKKDYATAEPLLNKVVSAHPDSYQAWFDLGFVYNAEGNTAESVAAYRKSVAAKPDVFESNLNLGLQLAKTGQPDAEQFLRAATTLKPTANVDEGHSRAWLSLAHVLADRNPDEAIDAYKQAAALQPNDPEPHLAAGALLEKENRFADAEAEYRQALRVQPNSADALIGLSNIYMRGQRLADAEEFLRKLVVLQPDNAAAHVQLGRVMAAAGHNDAAVAELQTALQLQPNDLAIQRDLADLDSSTGKYDEAEKSYRLLLAAHPDDATLHYGLGLALLKQKKFPAAEQEFLTAVKLKPDYGEAYGDLAVAATENKDYELAIRAADARAKYLPEIPVAYFLRASAYDHLRDYKQAAQNYHKFLEVANGQYPDQEWQARHRLIAIEPKK